MFIRLGLVTLVALALTTTTAGASPSSNRAAQCADDIVTVIDMENGSVDAAQYEIDAAIDALSFKCLKIGGQAETRSFKWGWSDERVAAFIFKRTARAYGSTVPEVADSYCLITGC